MAEPKVVLELDKDMALYLNSCIALAYAQSHGQLMNQLAILANFADVIGVVGIEKINTWQDAFMASCKAAFPEIEVMPLKES